MFLPMKNWFFLQKTPSQLGLGCTSSNSNISNFWQGKIWQKFGNFQILAAVVLEKHFGTKVSLIDI